MSVGSRRCPQPEGAKRPECLLNDGLDFKGSLYRPAADRRTAAAAECSSSASAQAPNSEILNEAQKAHSRRTSNYSRSAPDFYKRVSVNARRPSSFSFSFPRLADRHPLRLNSERMMKRLAFILMAGLGPARPRRRPPGRFPRPDHRPATASPLPAPASPAN